MSSVAHPPRVVLLDIEGTTAPVSFVHQVLFPYARTHLPQLVAEQAKDPAVHVELEEIARLAPGVPPMEQLTRWMDEDAKVGPLKALQGIVWGQGAISAWGTDRQSLPGCGANAGSMVPRRADAGGVFLRLRACAEADLWSHAAG